MGDKLFDSAEVFGWIFPSDIELEAGDVHVGSFSETVWVGKFGVWRECAGQGFERSEGRGSEDLVVDMPAHRYDNAYMKKVAPIQYTLRQIPRALDEALRKKSREEGKSMNQTAIETLSSGLAREGVVILHRDLDFMVGSWVEDPAFDEAIREQDVVDPKLWA